jgi:hypothetical protein
VNDCRWERSPEDAGYCLLTVVDGNGTGAFSLGTQLAQSLESGAFATDPRFVCSASDEAQAERIAAALDPGGEMGTATASAAGDAGTGETMTAGADAGAGSSATATEQTDGGATPGFTVATAFGALGATSILGRARS